MRSQFQFSKQQRIGILFFLTLIVIIQCIYFFLLETTNTQTEVLSYKAIEKEIDSLKRIAIQDNRPKIFPFNPNFITDYKGYTLGMSNEEIDRLLDYRKQNKWINSAKQFQVVTKVSDSLLNQISPYFKFPEWINKNRANIFKNQTTYNPKTEAQKRDLNLATAEQLQAINGVGKTLSNRIIKYRDTKLGGFTSHVQLQDVYGLSSEVIARINEAFTIRTPITLTKVNLNKAKISDLVTIPHIDYQLAHHIIEQRTLREQFHSLDDLKKVNTFPVDKFDIIKLYLKLNEHQN